MKYTNLSLKQEELEVILLPLLLGNVFHVTSGRSFESILDDGAILNSRDGGFAPTCPQTENCYVKRHGCVCLFDFRHISAEHLEDVLLRYPVLDPPWAQCKPVFILMDDSIGEKLIPWTTAMEASDGTNWIPYGEAWYPGDIGSELFNEVIRVDVSTQNEVKEILVDF